MAKCGADSWLWCRLLAQHDTMALVLQQLADLALLSTAWLLCQSRAAVAAAAATLTTTPLPLPESGRVAMGEAVPVGICPTLAPHSLSPQT